MSWIKGPFLDGNEKGRGGVSHSHEWKRGWKGFSVSSDLKKGFGKKGEVMR